MRHRSFLVLPLCLLMAGATASAAVVEGGGDVPPVSTAPMGLVAVRRGVQGPAGLLTARFLVLTNASQGSLAKPTSFAPDLFYALTDSLQVGLLHTTPMGWQTRPGAGLCVTGTGNGCPRVYNNVGFDLLSGLLFGDVHLSAHTSLYLLQLSDPAWVLWTIGLAGKLHFTDAVALFFDPQLGITLAHRGLYKDQLFLPLELQFQVTSSVSLKVLSGVSGQLSALGDTVQSPLGLGLVGNVNPHLDLGLRFSFDNLLGRQLPGTSRTDQRSLGLLLSLRG